MELSVPVTAVIAAHRRESVLRVIGAVKACMPAPAEIIVHVDGADRSLVRRITSAHPEVHMLTSERLLGPGGARNRLVRAASHEFVASFDDDAWPDHPDYFQRVLDVARLFPHAAMLSAASMPSEWEDARFVRLAVPSGCASVFRRSWFLRTRGFVPLPFAYGMEETDIGLQLFDLGGAVVHDPGLRACHDHPGSPTEHNLTMQALVFCNNALLMALRYPVVMMPVAIAQVAVHTLRKLVNGERALLLKAARQMPFLLARHRHQRRAVSVRSVLGWLWLKRRASLLAPVDRDENGERSGRGISAACGHRNTAASLAVGDCLRPV